mmetsp:Transcript_21771/g.58542  ORF Transcript_21771/g.58542 Transcript_21771/m.58542 type:complete len:292 (-) Transcript_21771:230-1105(-)
MRPHIRSHPARVGPTREGATAMPVPRSNQPPQPSLRSHAAVGRARAQSRRAITKSNHRAITKSTARECTDARVSTRPSACASPRPVRVARVSTRPSACARPRPARVRTPTSCPRARAHALPACTRTASPTWRSLWRPLLGRRVGLEPTAANRLGLALAYQRQLRLAAAVDGSDRRRRLGSRQPLRRREHVVGVLARLERRRLQLGRLALELLPLLLVRAELPKQCPLLLLLLDLQVLLLRLDGRRRRQRLDSRRRLLHEAAKLARVDEARRVAVEGAPEALQRALRQLLLA